MKPSSSTLRRALYSFSATTHVTPITTLHFDHGPSIKVWKSDPGLEALRRGVDVVFGNSASHQVTRTIHETVYTILQVDTKGLTYAV